MSLANPRSQAVRDALSHRPIFQGKPRVFENFGKWTFNRAAMEECLSKEVLQNVLEAAEGRGKLRLSFADVIAGAMKKWATEHKATHFCHWFQPLTGQGAEKQDAFLDWQSTGDLIEKFSGSQLLCGEPDASSFPSGGLRSTPAARGYTSWDPSSPPFIWQVQEARVLCIPSIFYSWSGEALDMKIPLLRSHVMVNTAAMRLLKLFHIQADSVFSTLGCEQEYFLVDRSLYYLRPDLSLCGRTLCGAPSSKGQELEDHYFTSIKERVLAYISDFEETAFTLGIPLKTRHTEVAPAQFEVAPLFAHASLAVDQNIILMELMRQVAARHNFVCLLHEKPFAGINGSGKHNNWSLATDTGINLFSPKAFPEEPVLFFLFIAAVLHAVHENAGLLRTSIASAGNDHRLGGHEAPPVIISVYLGEALERLLENVEKGKEFFPMEPKMCDLQLSSLPPLMCDPSDRNRTSPFAFTGNKFEFRAVGSSANPAFPLTTLNAAVAHSLNKIVDEIEKESRRRKNLEEASMHVLRRFLKASRPIRFSGNNYSLAWEKEAKKRGLPIIEKSYSAFLVLKEKPAEKIFEGILSKEELMARYTVLCENYGKVLNIEAKLLIEISRTQIIPVALEYQKNIAKGLSELKKAGIPPGLEQKNLCKKLAQIINHALEEINSLDVERHKAIALHGEKLCEAFGKGVSAKCLELRRHLDELEALIDDRLWPLPKYRELLSLI